MSEIKPCLTACFLTDPEVLFCGKPTPGNAQDLFFALLSGISSGWVRGHEKCWGINSGQQSATYESLNLLLSLYYVSMYFGMYYHSISHGFLIDKNRMKNLCTKP